MGNEASRATGDGLTPRGFSPGASPGALASPRTPTGASGSVRRAKSFSSTNAENSNGNSNGERAHQTMDKTIQRMDKTIRKRVRGGITYNMKIILRGDKGTGKTSLFHRLKGLPIPSSHEATPQLQSATINWSFRVNSEESVKCDVWDVVDKGFVVGEANGAAGNGEPTVSSNPFEAGGGAQTSGAHMVATVDATTVDVYHETHGVVFLLDVTKPHTLEYVRQQLDQVPVHIPTLVLGNFRDCGAQRKIFKEDIQELLYGGATTSSRTLRRPQELLYFECSLLNCYGLKALHQYFGIPFLQLKQQTIRQQLRIVEGEFAHLKHDLQAKIAEQRYAEYLDHIKNTGSDIRTGKRVSGTKSGVSVGDVVTSTIVDDESPKAATRLDRTQSSSSDIVVGTGVAASEVELSPSEMPELPTPAIAVPRQVELDDLPERATAHALQAGPSLKIDYTEAEQQKSAKPAVEKGIGSESNTVSPSARPTDDVKPSEPPVSSKAKARAVKAAPSETKKTAPVVKADEGVINLEDFQVPKARYNELDDFYSDDNSDEDAGDDDEDVVVGPSGARRLVSSASAKYSHKQLFLESDDSDSDGEVGHNRSRGIKKNDAPPASQPQRSPRRQNLAKPVIEVGETASSVAPTPTPPSPTRASPPSAPSPRAPVSPQARMSPQHSPRRRVKEAPTVVVVDETTVSDECIVETDSHDQHAEEVMEPVPAETSGLSHAESVQTEQNDVAEGVEVEGEEPFDDQHAQATVVESKMEESSDVTEVLAAKPVEECIPEHDDAVPEVDETHDDDALDVLVKMQAQDVSSAGEVEDDELVVAPMAGEMDSFFSDDNEEEAKPNGVKDENESEERVEIDRQAPINTPVDVVGSLPAVEEVKYAKNDVSEVTASGSAPALAQLNEESRPAIVHSDSDYEIGGPVISLPHASVVTQLKQQHQPVALALSDDDSDEQPEPKSVSTKPSGPANTSAQRTRKVEMLMSDEEDSDADAPPPQKPPSAFAPVQIVRETKDETSFPSPPFAPMAFAGSMKSSDLLEDFLNDSGSDSDTPSRPPLASKRPVTSVVNRDDDEDEEEDEDNGRFAVYDAKKSKQRTSKAARKQQRDEIQMLSMSSSATMSMSASTSRTSSFSNTSESNSRVGSLVSQDVLAAIRAAEQDALKMLEASTPVAKSTKSTIGNGDQTEEVTKKKKKSSSSSSSRHKSSRGEGDGGDGEEKVKKPKKKKDREASASSSKSKSKRREMILTDEDE